MANSDKNILITPSVGLSTNPTIKFNGANNTPTTLRVLDDGTVSFEGTAGQLFSISDGLTGSIFSVNDISGIPSIEVLDTGLVKLNQYGGSTVFGASAAIQNASSVNAKVSISTASATTPGLIIKAVSSQTANLQEWQNSSGTVLANVDASGFVNGSAYRQIGGNSNGFGIGTISNVLTAFGSGGNTTVIPIVTRGAASQTADLQQWQNSSGTVLARVASNGVVKANVGLVAENSTLANYTALQVNSTITNGNGIIVVGASGQTADLQQWQDSSGTVLANITSSGRLKLLTNSELYATLQSTAFSAGAHAARFRGAGGASVLRLESVASSTIGLEVIGASGQTANLQQWQDSSGTVLSYINSLGFTAIYAGLYVSGGGGQSTALLSVAGAPSVSSIIAKGAASQTADLQQWQNSSGTVLAKVDASGNVISGDISIGNGTIAGAYGLYLGGGTTGTYIGAALSVKPWAANVSGIIVRGYASQTADLQQWQNSVGDVLAKVQANGDATIYGSIISTVGSLQVAYAMRNLSMSTSNSGIGIQSWSPTLVTAMIRGAASQTANLQEWQTSSGTVVASMDVSGKLIVPTLRGPSGNVITLGTDGSPYSLSISNTQFDSYGPVPWRPYNTSMVGFIIKGLASQTADLQQWQDSNGNTYAKINTYGQLAIGDSNPSIYSNARISLNTVSASSTGQVIRGVASQTANLQEWQNSSGTLMAAVKADGSFRAGGANGATKFLVDQFGTLSLGTDRSNTGTATYLFVQSQLTTDIGAVIKGAAGQTANLQEWQDSSGTWLTSINSNGRLFLPRAEGIQFVGSPTALRARIYSDNANRLIFETANSGYMSLEPTGALFISSAPDSSKLIIRASTSQTVDLQQWQDGYSNVLAKVGSSGQFLISPSNSSVTALTVKASPTYPAAMQEWQNSSGTTLAQIRYNGILDIYTISPLNSNSGSYMDFTSSSININSRSTTTPTLKISSAASQTANLQEWQNSAGTVLASINPSGASAFASTVTAYGGFSTNNVSGFGNYTLGAGNAIVGVSTALTNYVGIIVKAVASQTANLQEWQDSAGTVLVKVRSSGQLNVGGAVAGTTLGIINIDPAWPAVKVVGASSQTASLQEWQLNDGTVRAKVDVDGYMGSTGVFGTTGKWSLETAYGGAFMGLAKTTSTVVNPGSDMARMYLVAGTNAGTLKLVVKAGASGAETTILDNIPQS